MSAPMGDITSKLEGWTGAMPERSGDFEALLPSRLSRPEDIQRYLGASPAWVQREAVRIEKVLYRFAEAAVDAMESPRCADGFLRRLDLRSISRDHNWRRIFSELADRNPCFDGHKRALIIRYMQYLSERKRLLDYVDARQSSLEETGERKWDVMVGACASEANGRLALGETAMVELAAGAAVSLRFAGLLFEFAVGSTGALSLSGPGSFRRTVRLGRSVVGRHPECDLVLEPQWRTVSRVQAIIEWTRDWNEADAPKGGGTLRVTNLSVHGTALRA